MIKLLFIVFLFCFPLNAKLIETKSPKALCSNGEQATFTFFEGKSNNWLMYIQGGGVAANEDQYRSRNDGLKSPAVSPDRGKTHMVEDFVQNGFNVLFVPYCSNDIHQGTHTHMIDGKEVYYHGRYIIEDIFGQFDNKFANADKLVFAGFLSCLKCHFIYSRIFSGRDLGAHYRCRCVRIYTHLLSAMGICHYWSCCIFYGCHKGHLYSTDSV